MTVDKVFRYDYDFDPSDESTAAKVVRMVGEQKRMLELGCGHGVMSKVFARYSDCDVFGVEYDEQAAEMARQYCSELAVVDIETADWGRVLGERRFDVIVAADVLEHLKDPASCLSALKTFLLPDGYFVLSVPNVAHNGVIAELLSNDFEYHETGLLDSTHIRFFGFDSLRRLIHDSGLELESIEFTRSPAEKTEFAERWSLLPDWFAAALESRPLGDVYQFILKAAPVENFSVEHTKNLCIPKASEFSTQEAVLVCLTSDRDAAITARDKAIALQKESLALRDRAMQDRDAAIRELDELKKSRTWRITRPLRFLGRLYRYGLLADDSERLLNALRVRYHTLPLPASLKSIIGRGYRKAQRSMHSIGHGADCATSFQAPEIRPPAQREGCSDYIVWGVIDWHFRHQRPQQLAHAISDRGRRVFYVSPVFVMSDRCGFEAEQIDAEGRLFQIKLYMSTPEPIYTTEPSEECIGQLRGSIGEFLLWAGCRNTVCLVQHPFWLDVAAVVPDSRVVYDCMDHHEGFGTSHEALQCLEKRLFATAYLTVTTSAWLDEAVAPFATDRIIIRNAGDYAHFSTPPSNVYRDPEGRKVIGYYGAIAEWFDIELVEIIAKRHPEAALLLVGSDTVHAKKRLGKLSNVTFVGEVAYAELPFYLYGFDLCLLPFQVMPLTLATNPVKVYEYLAAGKPVVSVDLPEMRQFKGLVYTAATHDAFAGHVDRLLAAPESPELAVQRRAFTSGQTWRDRADTLIDLAESQEREPLVSIVVVTWNNLPLTRKCVESIETFSGYRNLEIIFVDNASTDGTREFLKEQAASRPGFHIILNDENRGFAAANNQGLAIATGDFLIMLNNDTFVTGGWLRTLVGHLRRDSSIGIIGPVTNNIGNEAKIDISYDSMEEMALQAADRIQRHLGKLTPMRTIAFFCAAMPRTTWERIGPLDEAFGRGFFEDDDYCRRIEEAGLQVVCAEDVFIHHHLSASFDLVKQEERRKLFEENRQIYEKKWGSWIPHVYRSAEVDMMDDGRPQPEIVPVVPSQTVGVPSYQKDAYSLEGVCPVCGDETRFYYRDKALWRESLTCSSCRSTSRYRSIARGLLDAIAELSGVTVVSLAALPKLQGQKLRVYDTQPPFYFEPCAYAIPDMLKASGWIEVALSLFKPDLLLGSAIDTGITNQNLECLTFPDNSLDLVVTSDVMEHVRLDDRAHKEIFRVLRPGGIYLFTVPHDFQMERTLERVLVRDADNPESDLPVLEPEYHGDTNSDDEGGVLSYRVYGRDILNKLSDIGFEVEHSCKDRKELGIMGTELFYCRKPALSSNAEDRL